ncbi:MAG: class I SAM-dependent methyltransferase [Enhydrobacter sp.]|nr:class I SAM-dependent methyltransferase [Enhydrobacter sp.]
MSNLAASELMDRIYCRQRHVYDATRKFYLLGRDRLIRRLNPPAGGRVLEIGCGTARNLIVAARTYPDVHFFGIDISSEMLGTARRLVARKGLALDIRLARADATTFDPALLFGVPGFSRIFVSYSLSMMPGWQAVLERALCWVVPGGELHVVDFGGQERLPGWFRLGLRHWLRLFHVTPRDALESELTLLGLRAGALTVFERPFLGYAQYGICRRLGD